LRKSFIIVIALAFSTLGCKQNAKPTDKFNPNAPVSVDIAIAATQKVDKLVEANGSVLANDFVEIHPETNGRVVSLQIPEGKLVKAGTVLAKLNDADLQAQLKKIKSQLELAQINEKRNKQLLQVRGINQSDYDIALQQVKSLEADMDYTQSLIDKTIVKAPFTGQVGLRQISVGAFINNTTTIATIQKVDQLKVDFTIPESYQGYVRVGKKIQVEGIQNGAAKLNATIIAIEPQVIASTRNIKVRATLIGKMLPGAYTKVYLTENKQEPTIMVPSNIIIPDSKSKKVVVVKNGQAKFVDVETGYRTASGVEITRGLKVGDSVIVAGMLFVRDGAPLKIGKTISVADIIK
jgi:membrane fusion protein (multidrug efflux system)